VGTKKTLALLALERGWHFSETNLHCLRTLRICKLNPNFLAFIVSEILEFIRKNLAWDRLIYMYILYRVVKASVCMTNTIYSFHQEPQQKKGNGDDFEKKLDIADI